MDTLVVTATLGNRDTLDRTIQSVRKIGGNRIKHVLTAPKEKCDLLKEKYLLDIISEPENSQGIYPALNNALKIYAKDFKYLTYINDDDYWLPEFVKLFEVLDKNDDIDIVYSKTLFVDESENIIGEQTSSSRYKAFKALFLNNIILFTQQATLCRTELFLKIGGFDESYNLIADTKFWLKAIDLKAKLYYKNIFSAAYTIQENQLSSNKIIQKEEHERLSKEISFFVSDSSYHPIIEKYLYRIMNCKVYLKRFLK